MKDGNGPEAGRSCSMEENSRINKTANQKEGVAINAMEKTRMTWSGHRSRHSAEITPRMTASTTAIIRPMNVS